jgi:hypothetical protein
MAIKAFIETDLPKEDLATALRVIREFKKCETLHDWAYTPFESWGWLEELEGYLDHLVNGTPLDPSE